MAELQVSIQTSPAYFLCKKKEKATKLTSFFKWCVPKHAGADQNIGAYETLFF